MLRFTRLFREMAPELQLEYMPVLFTRTILGPQGGFAGEERLVKLEVARKYMEAGHAVTPTEELRRGLWCYNPDTDKYDCFIERNEEFLDFAARKRQWLDVYWRVNTGYLLFGRQSWGQGFLINCPLRKRDVAQKLWEQYKVRIDPRLIEFREKDRRTGIQELGHNWCWLYLPGAEELGINREVYDNKRVKVRIHVRKMNSMFALY
ncbi:uncharacterized protein TEOVI_000559300 [Trypanosoma equiperdum]|uniref:Uncharacterized protein n=5 Tax=Trypanozoon TaxID=39700 RepID=Q586A6_TRYB2|nr:hypothetical protein, conserved [Trypanosoma brucei gambiense DAL972]XP_845526.1 hypothetical protein, conserved [Trypanosoma brucei brucei TREU927]6HIV_BR Chain BR, mL84 [Trypanosoma brucei brucei]6HIX_BR Chain BR, ml84 [Trypanosoma brucei brucei]6YXX_BR Chain BR, mL84 [Trypanosoma brucei brucei]6YXY_BR Chain BR, mL84 [Trypanosoma brucei brucei]AAX80745.1 hypothetical protein, conserved [Trypanosoma brucei]RHW71762.1 hypothetical protein DPX39_060045100 [Trypanosoma brucei equiperdum]SC|eukprot:XP_011774193.1 hypothetical protein, conserved [Trypanosoma brucei gambiense DAL972]